jgi:hypothetical protein
MKVKCINNNECDYIYYLTIGKIYDVIYESIYDYKITNDDGYENKYHKELFKSLSKIRIEKINKLLDE